MVHVCYSLYDKNGHFSKILGTSMLSLLENASAPLTIHLLCFGKLSEPTLDRFRRLAGQYGQRLCLYDVSDWNSPVLPLMHPAWLEKFSPAAINRLFIWDILPPDVQRIIWLDADTIVNLDIVELWQEQTGANGFAAVVDNIVANLYGKESILAEDKDFDAKRYVNAGVVLMERARFCQPDWGNKIVRFMERYPHAWYCEQDILNYYYGQTGALLPERYNTLVGWQQVQHRETVEACIYHYSGSAYNFNFADVYTKLFFSYFVKTPWYDLDFLRRLCSVIPAVHDGRTLLLRSRYQLLEGRRKIAVGAAEHEAQIREVMQLADEESYLVFVPGKRQQAIDLAGLAGMRRDHVILLFDGSYADLADSLVQYGCREDVDFVNGAEFLTLAEGCPPHDEHAIFMQL